MNRLMPILCLAILFTFSQCSGCSSENDADNSTEETSSTESYNTQDDNPTASAAEALRNAADQIENMQSGTKEVVSYKVLKESVPNKLLGMDRVNLEGQKTGTAGFTFSSAEATFSDDDRELELNIVDAGGTGLATMGMAAWLQLEFERESDDGYERTTTIDGMKAFEKYERESQEGELALFYKERYIVTLSGENIGERDLRKAWKQLDLDLPK